jgi:hypothetical protein
MAPIALAATGVLVASTLAIWTVVAARQAGSEARIAYDGLWFIDATNPRSWLRAGAYGAISTAMMLFPRESARHIVALLGLAAGIWLLALLGLRTWPRRGKSELTCWTLVPWVLMLLAAVAHRYPFATPRVMVLLAPPLMLALGAGLVGVCRIVTIVFLSRGRARRARRCRADVSADPVCRPHSAPPAILGAS